MKKISKFLITFSIFSFLILPAFSFGQTTGYIAPVITATASDITSTGAVITVTIEKLDSSVFPIDLSLAWGKVGGTPQFISLGTTNLKATDLPYTITKTLNNLDPSTDTIDSSYSYRVVQTGSNAPLTSILGFKTLVTPAFLTITTTMQPTTDVTSNSATLHATVVSDGEMNDDTAFNFQCLTSSDYSSAFNDATKIKSFVSSTISSSATGTGTDISGSATGLNPSTTYHCRLKIGSSQTQVPTILSDETVFKTSANFIPITIPTVVTTNTNPVVVAPTTTTNTTTQTTSSSGITSSLVPCGTNTNPGACDFNALIKLVNNVVNFILFRLAVPIAAIMFAYAGFELLTAGGDTAKLKKAKTIFTNVAIGLVIAAAAWLIVHTILSILGYNGSWIGF